MWLITASTALLFDAIRAIKTCFTSRLSRFVGRRVVTTWYLVAFVIIAVIPRSTTVTSTVPNKLASWACYAIAGNAAEEWIDAIIVYEGSISRNALIDTRPAATIPDWNRIIREVTKSLRFIEATFVFITLRRQIRDDVSPSYAVQTNSSINACRTSIKFIFAC